MTPLERAVEALRSVRDTSISHDDAIHIAVEALRHFNVAPQPSFQDEIEKFLAGIAEPKPSLGDSLQRLAAADALAWRDAPTEEEIAERIQHTDLNQVPKWLLEDLRDPDIRCASCERQEHVDGPAGLCDGCLDALGEEGPA